MYSCKLSSTPYMASIGLPRQKHLSSCLVRSRRVIISCPQEVVDLALGYPAKHGHEVVSGIAADRRHLRNPGVQLIVEPVGDISITRRRAELVPEAKRRTELLVEPAGSDRVLDLRTQPALD